MATRRLALGFLMNLGALCLLMGLQVGPALAAEKTERSFRDRLDAIKSQIDGSGSENTPNTNQLALELIELKSLALSCEHESGNAADPQSASSVLAKKVCSAQVSEVERTLKDLRERRRQTLWSRLSRFEQPVHVLVAEALQSPLPAFKEMFFRRDLLPATESISMLVLCGLGIAGLCLGGWIRSRLAYAFSVPEQRWYSTAWRWQLAGAALGVAAALTWIESEASSALGGAVLAQSWATQISQVLAGLLLAERLLWVLVSPLLMDEDGSSKLSALSMRSGGLLVVFSLAQVFYFITLGSEPNPWLTLLGMGIRTVGLSLLFLLLVSMLGGSSRGQDSRTRRYLLGLLFLSAILIDSFGGNALIQFIFRGAVGTLLCLLAYKVFHQLVDRLFSDPDARSDDPTVFHALGVPALGDIRGAVWARLAVVLTSLMVLVAGIMAAWGLGETAYSILIDRIVNGIELGDTRLHPLRFLKAIAFLVAILLVIGLIRRGAFGRWLETAKIDSGAREIVLRVTEYGGIALAILASFSWTGVGVQDIALVAGAVSVGLGFGLQAFVSNIVAGFVLLVERPIRPGDWIQSGEVEGMVKSIKARATELQTINRSDVLVPNSTLTGQPLVNHTLRNTHGRIAINVALPHGVDPVRMMESFKAILESNPEVLNDGPSCPTVALVSIEDGLLRFELNAYVGSFRQRQRVESDINLAIYGLVNSRDQPTVDAGVDLPAPA